MLYGEAFRAPNAYELYWQQTDVAKANPRLQPETNQTGEVVVEHYLDSRFRIAATSFYYHINDLITQQTDPADGLLVYNNIDEVNARGVELEAEGEVAERPARSRQLHAAAFPERDDRRDVSPTLPATWCSSTS